MFDEYALFRPPYLAVHYYLSLLIIKNRLLQGLIKLKWGLLGHIQYGFTASSIVLRLDSMGSNMGEPIHYTIPQNFKNISGYSEDSLFSPK